MGPSGTQLGTERGQRYLELTLPLDSQAPSRARAAVWDLLGRADQEQLASVGSAPGSAMLLVSEVVTNALMHSERTASSDRLVLAASIEGDSIRVSVTDSGHGFSDDVKRHAGGYGFFLLDKLATRWGIEPSEGTSERSTVWFELSPLGVGPAI